ncbi:DMT family transporter [Pararhizobium haloflavum]|uniref:DMT family transporter n=1 Tax=Pararhizobium haloflavum TaxID=2037914 RepID=UPI000C1849B2|nr:DMT family transporter [Pararhizobium haloflavum]
MSARTASPGTIDYGLLLLLASLWGGSFILIKIALSEMPPATITAARLVLGAVFLGLIARVTGGGRLSRDGSTIALILLVGLVGNAAPFGLIAWGEELVDAGLASILMGIMPIATLVMAHVFANETLTFRKLIGVSIGFLGLVVLVGPALLRDLGQDGIRQLAILAAAICYGISAILTRRLIGQPRLALGAAILGAGALGIVPIALAFEQPWLLAPGGQTLLAVLLLGIFPTAVAALLVFQVIDRQGAGFFGQVNLLVPIMGVFWAIVILGEMPQPRAWLALFLILVGIAVARGASRAPATVRLGLPAASATSPTNEETSRP